MIKTAWVVAQITAILILAFSLGVRADADFELKLNKGIAAYVNRDYERALTHFRDALVIEPENPLANQMTGRSLEKLGRHRKALPYLERAEKLEPGLKGINMDLGSAYLRAERTEKARAQFEKAVSKEPTNAPAHYNLAYTLFLLERYEDSLGPFSRARELDPDLALPSLFYSGVANYRLQRYKESASIMEEVKARAAGTPFAQAAARHLEAISTVTKPLYGSLSMGFQYDSNVTLEPDGIEITDEDDVRGIVYLNLGFRPYISDATEIESSWRAFFSFHNDLDNLNVQNHRFAVKGTRRTAIKSKPLSYSLAYFYDLVLIDDSPASDLFSQTHSISPKLALKWSDTTSTEFYPELRFDNFKDFPERDALNLNFTLAQPLILYGGRLRVKPGVNVALNFADDLRRRRSFDEVSPKVFAEGLALLPYGVSLFVHAFYSAGDYYNDDFDRFDQRLGVRAVASKTLYRTISLDVGYENVSNFSDDDFPGEEPFEYFRNIISVTLTARF